jgi:hypothetical protein
LSAATKNRAVKLFERITTLTRAGYSVTFSPDFDGLTVSVDGIGHWHSHPLVTNTDELIQWLYQTVPLPGDVE